MDTVDHVYSVYIKASPDRIWRAITDGDETVRYYYGTRVGSSWEVGAPITYTYPDGSVAADGSDLEIEPGRKVVMTFHPRWDPEIEAEGPMKMTWAIEPGERDGEPSRLVVTSALIPGLEDRGRVQRWSRLHRVGAQDGDRDRRVDGCCVDSPPGWNVTCYERRLDGRSSPSVTSLVPESG